MGELPHQDRERDLGLWHIRKGGDHLHKDEAYNAY